ncbi:MAG: thioredoxin fold domain-containing protein [Candidatus Bathyarchaeota archaeon]|nr:MAG: thioredoxin fold domain-containing protein [Candidatus Bathyarchaeota archaeon]
MHSVSDVNADNWEKEVLQADTLVVVDFWHDQCPWCKRLEPIYSEVSEEYRGKVKFSKLNVLTSSENQQVAVKYGVMGTPTLVFFCDGRPIETVVGFQPKERLKQLVDDVIDKHRDCIEKSTASKIS